MFSYLSKSYITKTVSKSRESAAMLSDKNLHRSAGMLKVQACTIVITKYVIAMKSEIIVHTCILMNNVLLTLIVTVEMHHTLFIHADEFGRWRS